MFGLLPALQLSRPDVTGVLKDGGRSGTAGSRQLARRGLVVLQMASSVVLALAAGLLIRSLIELNRIDLGFNPDNVLTAQLQVPATDYPAAGGRGAFLPRRSSDASRRSRRPRGRRGARAAAGADDRRLVDQDRRPSVRARGKSQRRFPGGHARLLQGDGAAAGARPVPDRSPIAKTRCPRSVINDTMAARYWPGEDAIGRQFMMGTDDKPWLTIVGIVGTVRHNAVVEEPRAEMYLAHAQLPAHIRSAPRGMTLVVKTEGDPLALAGSVREAIRSIDRNLPVSDIRTMEDVAADALSQPRFMTFLLGAVRGASR